MKTASEIAERINSLEATKMCLLFPPGRVPALTFLVAGRIISEAGHDAELREQQEIPLASAQTTLESLNAEIAALAWVLRGKSSTDDGRGRRG